MTEYDKDVNILEDGVSGAFNFDAMMKMAQENPEALEALRKKAVAKVIDSAPEASRARLEGLQFQIDGIILVSKTPMKSCIELSRMMHDNLSELRDLLNGESSRPSSLSNSPKADVVKFPDP